LNRRLALLGAVMLSVASCGRDSTPTSPPPSSSVVTPAGNWSGSITDAISGEGTMQLSLSDQAQSSLTGTWSATFKNGDSFSGPAVGGLFVPNAYGIMLSVQPPPPCTTVSGPGASAAIGFVLTSVVVTSSQLNASSGRISCSGNSFGTVNLSKQ